jgi:hypothetical protein
MEPLSVLSGVTLAGALLCTVLWYITPQDSSYETVEMAVVSTKKVFLHLAIVLFGSWLALKYFFKRRTNTCSHPTYIFQLKPFAQSINSTQDGIILDQLWCVRKDLVPFEKFHSHIRLI